MIAGEQRNNHETRRTEKEKTKQGGMCTVFVNLLITVASNITVTLFANHILVNLFCIGYNQIVSPQTL